MIKKQGKIPFSEHMTITTDPAGVNPEQSANIEALEITEELKRELKFYNNAKENV